MIPFITLRTTFFFWSHNNFLSIFKTLTSYFWLYFQNKIFFLSLWTQCWYLYSQLDRKISLKELALDHFFFFFLLGVTCIWLGGSQLWKILKKMGISDHLTCLLRNLYAGLEATVRTGLGTTNCFQIGKGVGQGRILSPCLFNLYADYIMRNTGLEEAQAGIKTAGRNTNNLIYAGDTTLTAESKQELKSLVMKVKRRVKKLA